jgi:hypothetical protein
MRNGKAIKTGNMPHRKDETGYAKSCNMSRKTGRRKRLRKNIKR